VRLSSVAVAVVYATAEHPCAPAVVGVDAAGGALSKPR
jgi:hypothetical protein